MLEVGQSAPDFSLENETGERISLSDFRGKKVIVYFYPKDDTPGCTKEAIAFTDVLDKIRINNGVVLGISKDSVNSHEKFINKYNLKVTLLADTTGKTCENYGVWQEKQNYGKTTMGIVRTTFLIDENGKVAKVWKNVSVDGHADACFLALSTPN